MGASLDNPSKFGDWSPFDLPLTDPRHPFHVHHMELALEEAGLAAAADEVPVGAVIVSFDKGIIARAHNQRELLKDPPRTRR
jgi:tRNA(adenine34) deaminase